MAEDLQPKPIKDLFGLGDKYYGSPVLSNPYLHVSTLTAESVRAEWTKVLKYFAHPVTIAANERSDFKDVKSALTTARVKRASATPKVAVPSVTQIASRFVVDVKKHKKDAENGFDLPPLAVFFKPALTAIEGTDLEQLIREIHSNLLCLFSVASMHYQAMKDDELTGHYELTNEQVLFTNILKAFVGSLTSPCVIHSQCMTEQNKTSKIMLPSAKFDLLVNTSSSGEPAESTIVVLVNGQAEEHAELVVSNETNRTMNHKKLNVTVALEALIFAEVSRQEFTKIINASSRLVRPLMRLKSNDLLYTSSEALYWAYEDSGELRFNIPGCIILLLFLRAGLGAYPEYDPSDVFGTQHTQPASGWNEAYASLPNDAKYPRILKQTKPTLNRPTKLKVSEPETLIEGNPVDYVVQWRKRHRSE